MGRAITYCVQCSKRVSETDLETGKAFRIGDRILCKACAPEQTKVQTTKKVPRPRDHGTSVTLKTQKTPAAATPAPPAAAPDPRKKKIVIGAAAGAVALLLLVLVLVLTRSGAPPAVALPPDLPTPPPGGSVLPADAKVSAAKADLEKARAFAKSHPDDPAASMKEYNEIVWKWEGTDAAAQAAKEAAAIKAGVLGKVKAWMADAETQIKDLTDKGELRAAARKLEAMKPVHDLMEWRQAVEKRVSELFVEAAKAEDRKKAGEEKPVAENPPKPADKAAGEEAKGYPAKWEAAVGRATARDPAGALAELDRLAAAAKDEDVRAEAAQDAKDLRAMTSLLKSGMDVLKKKPRGATLSLHARVASGETKKLGGLILQIDAERVELRAAKGTVFVEWEDVASSTVAADAKADPRLLAQLCLLEGEVEAAKTHEAEVAPKWWAFGGRARSLLPKADPGEKGARELYYSAERSFRSMETRAASIESYKTLRTDFGATSLVKAYSERISRRMDLGKEYYFAPADFHEEGTFRLSKTGKLESVKDSDDPDTLRNVAELEFAALPGVGYRCWLWTGACCEETFLFYMQGTEVTDTDPKTRKKIPCEPGSNVASPVKHSIRQLKKTHAEHKPKGQKEHPKTAARWEWIEIPLPKYAAAGGKKLRFMTNQAGFSIGGAVVSSTRKAAPVEGELKDLEKDRDVPEVSPVDADLVAWWTLDEGGVDATGKGHDAKVVGTVEWVEGKIGGAARFTAPGPTLRVEDADDLNLAGDLTLALWMKKEGDAGDWSALIGKGEKQERNYCLWLETNTRQILFQEYGAAAVGLKSKAAVPDGAWTHVAATVEGSKATIYINGVKDGELVRGGAASVVKSPLGLGYACEHGTYKGLLDDVRVYRRALSAEEVRALAELAR